MPGWGDDAVLACTETVTLIHPVREDDGDRYTCTAIHGASWRRKGVVALDGDGARPVPICKVRIPAENMPQGVSPGEGDYLVRGLLEAVRRAPADLAGREYVLLSTVGDNRRGRFPHWFLSGGT